MATGSWILKSPEDCKQPSQQKRMRLFCFAPMATGAYIFQDWGKALPQDVEVMPVELPGRNSRSSEPSCRNMSVLVKQLVDALKPQFAEKPFAFFGHSMGAWVAYELASELRHHNLVPLKIFASANRAPHLHGVHNDVDPTVLHTLEGAEFWRCFERRYGPSPLLQMPEVQQWVFPVMKADLELLENYTPADLQPLACPIAACGATDDNRYTKEQLEAWKLHTTSEFSEHWFPGNHRYIQETPAPFLEFLAQDLQKL